MVRTGKQTTYFQTTEQRSVYDPSRGHTCSRGQVSLQEGIGRCLEEENSFFFPGETQKYSVLEKYLWESTRSTVPCSYLPEITTVSGLHLSCGLRDSWNTVVCLAPHLHESQYTHIIHPSQQNHESTLVPPGGQHSDGQVEATWGRTYDTLGEWCALERGQAQVPDLDRSSRTCDKNVVALQVPVDDRGGPSVQEVETLEDLPAPAAEDFDFHHLEPL